MAWLFLVMIIVCAFMFFFVKSMARSLLQRKNPQKSTSIYFTFKVDATVFLFVHKSFFFSWSDPSPVPFDDDCSCFSLLSLTHCPSSGQSVQVLVWEEGNAWVLSFFGLPWQTQTINEVLLSTSFSLRFHSWEGSSVCCVIVCVLCCYCRF